MPDAAFQIDDLEAVPPVSQERARGAFQWPDQYRNVIQIIGNDRLLQVAGRQRQRFGELEEARLAQGACELVDRAGSEFRDLLLRQQALGSNRYATVQVSVFRNGGHGLQPLRIDNDPNRSLAGVLPILLGRLLQ